MPDERLFIFATIRPEPDFFEDARLALEALIPPTLAEPGCHMFSVFVSRDEPTVLHLFECFENDAALEAHYAQSYTREVFGQYEGWLASPVEIRKLNAASLASSDQFK